MSWTCTVRQQCVLILGLTVCSVGTRLSRAGPLDPLTLVVHVYNYAAVRAEILVHAEQHAAEVFLRAGIILAWIDCPLSPNEVDIYPACKPGAASSTATLKTLNETMAAGYGLPFSKYGVTIQHHASFVFCERAHDLANRNDLSEPVVLGQIIAHELGHLVLGEGAHSDSGIMKEDLYVKDFRQAEKGRTPTFSTEQAQRIQARMLEGVAVVPSAHVGIHGHKR